MNYQIESVVGTTFRHVSLAELKMPTDSRDIPERTFNAWVWPEPNNKFDKYAKRVELRIPDGDGWDIVKSVGYLKKNSPLYRRLKVNKYKPLACQVKVRGFSVNGLNDEYQLIYDKDNPRFK